MLWVLVYLAQSLSILRLILERWCLLGSENFIVTIVSESHWISWTGILLPSVRSWSLRLLRNLPLWSSILLLMTCVEFGWSIWFVCHILFNRPFLHNLLVLVLGIRCCCLICLQCLGFGFLLNYFPLHCFPRLVGLFSFPFPEPYLFLSDQCWTCSIILVPHGT